MAKRTYKYNPNSLHFEPIDKGSKGKIFQFILYFIGGLFCTFLLYTVYINNFETIKKQKLLQKNDLLITQYNQLNNNLTNLESELSMIAQTDDNLYRALLGKSPLGEDVRNAGIGGSDRYEQFEKYENYEILKQTTQNIEVLLNKLDIQSQSFNEVVNETNELHKTINGKPNIQPVSLKEFKRISSDFGYRWHPVHGRKLMHDGIDFAGPIGTKIHATGDGVVTTAHRNRFGYGNLVIIEHHGGYKTKYAHLDKILVTKGDKITRGQIIATMGNTGISTGPHLHYEVILNGKTQNPNDYYFHNLSIGEYEQITKFNQEN